MTGTKPIPAAICVVELFKQAEKVNGQIQDLSAKLTNSELPLSELVRLDVQRRELEAYLSGLLYALDKL